MENEITYIIGIGIFLYYYSIMFEGILKMPMSKFLMLSAVASVIMYALMYVVMWLSIGNIIRKRDLILPSAITGLFVAMAFKAIELNFR